MAKIVFMCEMEEGHLLPTFGLAHSLKRRGHEVIYVSVADNEDYIKEQGFSFYCALESLYPKGLRSTLKKNAIDPVAVPMMGPDIFQKYHVQKVIKGAYDKFVNELNADLFMISFYMPFDTLMLYYKYNITPVILSPVMHRHEKTTESELLLYIHNLKTEEKCQLVDFLSERQVDVSSFKDVIKPLTNFQQLIFCPAEFEVGRPVATPHMHFIEPSIRNKTSSIDIYNLYGIPSTKKIIYASMGSQALRHGIACTIFFNKIIQAMKSDSFHDLHLILTIDANFNTSNLLPVPDNVTIASWAPQIDVLKVASVAIIHGGLGSVKECIYFGVPVIVFPQGYDQPANAERIVHHNLGFADDILTVSETKMRYYITQALNDDRIKKGIQRMRRIFHEKEERQEGATIVENIMAMEPSLP